MWPFPEPLNDWFGTIKEQKRSERAEASDDRDIVPLDKNEDPRIRAARGR